MDAREVRKVIVTVRLENDDPDHPGKVATTGTTFDDSMTVSKTALMQVVEKLLDTVRDFVDMKVSS